jgi:hypothetical protein
MQFREGLEIASGACRPPEAALEYALALTPRAHFALLCVRFPSAFPRAVFRWLSTLVISKGLEIRASHKDGRMIEMDDFFSDGSAAACVG